METPCSLIDGGVALSQKGVLLPLNPNSKASKPSVRPCRVFLNLHSRPRQARVRALKSKPDDRGILTVLRQLKHLQTASEEGGKEIGGGGGSSSDPAAGKMMMIKAVCGHGLEHTGWKRNKRSRASNFIPVSS